MAPTRAKVTRMVPTMPQKKPLRVKDVDASSFLDTREIVEKDETEERLEKLIFGDEEGFLHALKAEAPDRELLRKSTSSEEEQEHPEGEEDLEGVADEDVWSA